MTPSQIRRLRTRLGDSRKEFAERCGVSFETVVSWEVGRRTPSPMARKLLAMVKKYEAKGGA